MYRCFRYPRTLKCTRDPCALYSDCTSPSLYFAPHQNLPKDMVVWPLSWAGQWTKIAAEDKKIIETVNLFARIINGAGLRKLSCWNCPQQDGQPKKSRQQNSRNATICCLSPLISNNKRPNDPCHRAVLSILNFFVKTIIWNYWLFTSSFSLLEIEPCVGNRNHYITNFRFSLANVCMCEDTTVFRHFPKSKPRQTTRKLLSSASFVHWLLFCSSQDFMGQTAGKSAVVTWPCLDVTPPRALVSAQHPALLVPIATILVLRV